MLYCSKKKEKEITTEGGIDVRGNHNILVPKIEKIKKNNIRVSLFIDASKEQIKMAKEIGMDVEDHFLDTSVSEEKLLELIDKLNNDQKSKWNSCSVTTSITHRLKVHY